MTVHRMDQRQHEREREREISDRLALSWMRWEGMLLMRMLACVRSLFSAGCEGWYWIPSPVLHVTKLYVFTPAV
jgi:hypothetical protein